MPVAIVILAIDKPALAFIAPIIFEDGAQCDCRFGRFGRTCYNIRVRDIRIVRLFFLEALYLGLIGALAGPDRAYASAIIVIDYESVGQWAGKRRVAYRTFAELSQKPEVYRLVKDYIDRINHDLPAGVRLKKYVNLHKEFDPEEGELTRTRKLRRSFLEERYRGLIHAIYNDEKEVGIEVEAKQKNRKTVMTRISIQSVEGAE